MLAIDFVRGNSYTARMNPFDFKGVFKKAVLQLQRSTQPHDDYHVFEFRPAHDMTWQPGEHGIFSFPDKDVKGKKWRAFSIAAAPEEGVVRIATHIGSAPSDFKATLRALQPDDLITLRGPFGWFKLRDATAPLVMLAGGVGITPIRALWKSLEKDQARPVTLIYGTSGKHLFQEDLMAVAKQNPQLTPHFVQAREEVSQLAEASCRQHENAAWYYLSGTRAMTNDLKKQLRKQGIEEKRIIVDPFLGY